MKHRKIIGVVATVMLLTCLAVVPVMAQAPPPAPCTFVGTVTLDGVSVVEGTTITAELADTGAVVGTTSTYIRDSVSKYFMPVEQIEGVPAEGAALNFYVDGYLGGSSSWEAMSVKTVNLAATSGVGPTTYTLTTTVSPAGSGTVSPSSGTYVAGTVVALTATAASGYTFNYWGGAASGTSRSTTVTMTSNKSVTAHFKSVGPTPEYATFADWINAIFV